MKSLEQFLFLFFFFFVFFESFGCVMEPLVEFVAGVMVVGVVAGIAKETFNQLKTPPTALVSGNTHFPREDCRSFEHFGTNAIHTGQPPDPHTQAVIPPISLSTTFAQETLGKPGKFGYARGSNPTRNSLETCLASLENALYAITFASGMAATMSIGEILEDGSEILSVKELYGGTTRYFLQVVSSRMKLILADISDPDILRESLSPKTKMVWIETPTNPKLSLTDIKVCCDIVHQYNSDIIVVVDNTFLTPYFQRPLDLGADLVLHSISKYLNGHSDVLMGAVITNNEELSKKIKFSQRAIGAIPSPFDCFLVLRGLKTLHIRMKKHEENALACAHFLSQHPKIEKTIYPGLPSHPQHELAKRQQMGHGGVIAVFVKGGERETTSFLKNLRVFCLAESLGGVESLASHPVTMSHSSLSPEARVAMGITENLVRLSVGIEETEDLLADLERALAAV